MVDAERVEREVEELLTRPLGRSAEELSTLLTDCAAVALHIRAAIMQKQREGAEMKALSALSGRISDLMGEIRQRLDRVTPRS